MSKITDAVSLGFDPAQGQSFMDEAASISRQIASDAIDAAIARGGNALAIIDAQTSLSLGDTARLTANYDGATQDYRDAYDKAAAA